MTTSSRPSLPLTPAVPPNKGVKGMLPHHRYRLIRSKAEEIVRLREEVKWSNNRAGRTLGFRSAGDYDRAYLLIKANEERLVLQGDWTGVEKVVYDRFPDYESAAKFRELLKEFDDPRVRPDGRLFNAPLAPVRPPPRAPAPVPPTPPEPALSGLDEPAPPIEIRRRFGKPTQRDPLIVAQEEQTAHPRN